MKNKNLEVLRAYKRWFNGRGAKYQSCLPPSISVEDVRKALDAACDALKLRLPTSQFSCIVNGAEHSLARFTERRSVIEDGMTDEDKREFAEFCTSLKDSVKAANKILRAIRKNGAE